MKCDSRRPELSCGVRLKVGDPNSFEYFFLRLQWQFIHPFFELTPVKNNKNNVTKILLPFRVLERDPLEAFYELFEEGEGDVKIVHKNSSLKPSKKRCFLCRQSYPPKSLSSMTTFNKIARWRKRRGSPISKSCPLWRDVYQPVSLCVFCSQLICQPKGSKGSRKQASNSSIHTSQNQHNGVGIEEGNNKADLESLEMEKMARERETIEGILDQLNNNHINHHTQRHNRHPRSKNHSNTRKPTTRRRMRKKVGDDDGDDPLERPLSQMDHRMEVSRLRMMRDYDKMGIQSTTCSHHTSSNSLKSQSATINNNETTSIKEKRRRGGKRIPRSRSDVMLERKRKRRSTKRMKESHSINNQLENVISTFSKQTLSPLKAKKSSEEKEECLKLREGPYIPRSHKNKRTRRGKEGRSKCYEFIQSGSNGKSPIQKQQQKEEERFKVVSRRGLLENEFEKEDVDGGGGFFLTNIDQSPSKKTSIDLLPSSFPSPTPSKNPDYVSPQRDEIKRRRRRRRRISELSKPLARNDIRNPVKEPVGLYGEPRKPSKEKKKKTKKKIQIKGNKKKNGKKEQRMSCGGREKGKIAYISHFDGEEGEELLKKKKERLEREDRMAQRGRKKLREKGGDSKKIIALKDLLSKARKLRQEQEEHLVEEEYDEYKMEFDDEENSIIPTNESSNNDLDSFYSIDFEGIVGGVEGQQQKEEEEYLYDDDNFYQFEISHDIVSNIGSKEQITEPHPEQKEQEISYLPEEELKDFEDFYDDEIFEYEDEEDVIFDNPSQERPTSVYSQSRSMKGGSDYPQKEEDHQTISSSSSSIQVSDWGFSTTNSPSPIPSKSILKKTKLPSNLLQPTHRGKKGEQTSKKSIKKEKKKTRNVKREEGEEEGGDGVRSHRLDSRRRNQNRKEFPSIRANSASNMKQSFRNGQVTDMVERVASRQESRKRNRKIDEFQ